MATFYKDAEEKYVRTVVLYAKKQVGQTAKYDLYADTNLSVIPDPITVFNAYVNGCLKIMKHNGESSFINGIITPTEIKDGDGYVQLSASTDTYFFAVDNGNGDVNHYFKEYK